MKSYVITILQNKRSVKVANRCIKSGAKCGITVEQWRATTPKDNPNQLLLSENIVTSGLNEKYSRSNNCAAAFHSHFSLWKHCININETILIMEHDAVIVGNIPNITFNKVITLAKPSYGNYNTPNFLGVGLMVQAPYTKGAHGYMVNPSGARKLIDKAKTDAGPTDVFLNKTNFPFIQEYYPWLIEAHDSFTTIQNIDGCKAKHNYGETYDIEAV